MANLRWISRLGDRVGLSRRPDIGAEEPPKRLVAFTRVGLAPGESRTVHLTVPVSLLAVTPGDIDGAGTPRVAPGDYVFSAGDSTSTVTLR